MFPNETDKPELDANVDLDVQVDRNRDVLKTASLDHVHKADIRLDENANLDLDADHDLGKDFDPNLDLNIDFNKESVAGMNQMTADFDDSLDTDLDDNGDMHEELDPQLRANMGGQSNADDDRDLNLDLDNEFEQGIQAGINRARDVDLNGDFQLDLDLNNGTLAVVEDLLELIITPALDESGVLSDGGRSGIGEGGEGSSENEGSHCN